MANETNCQICGINKAKYFCPSCNIPYCSVTCYQAQAHLQCSENFYEKWVHEELKNSNSDLEAKRRMLEILKQNQELDSESLDSDDDVCEPDLATRMADINLDDEEEVWAKLTPEERKNFRKLVGNGDIIKLLPEWEPWWQTKKKKTLIQDCENDFDWRSVCPTVPNVIPKLSTFTKSQPSSSISFMVLNVLASYVYTVRWFKGSYRETPVESISTIIALSGVLRNNKVFENPVAALFAFEEDLTKCDWIKQGGYNKHTIHKDIRDIVKGADGSDLFYCLKAALTDLDSLCTQAVITIKNSKTHHIKRFSGPLPKVSLLQQISKKLNFYLSWTVEHGQTLINLQFFS